MKKMLPTLLIFLVFGGYIAFVMLRPPAKTPSVFDADLSLAEAEMRSAENGKPILILATADWCPPCQALKRGALTDPAVVELINEHTIPVYLEDGEHREELRTLPIQSYPTTLIIDDGRVSASIQGARGYESALKRALGLDG